MISTVRDITERTWAERVQQDFIAMASHDRRETYDQESVVPILEQTTRIERMITDLRELVQGEGGQLTLRVAPVELSELARHAADRVRIQRTGHPLRIESPGTR
jgi:signal transduction histidine kinase